MSVTKSYSRSGHKANIALLSDNYAFKICVISCMLSLIKKQGWYDVHPGFHQGFHQTMNNVEPKTVPWERPIYTGYHIASTLLEWQSETVIPSIFVSFQYSSSFHTVFQRHLMKWDSVAIQYLVHTYVEVCVVKALYVDAYAEASLVTESYVLFIRVTWKRNRYQKVWLESRISYAKFQLYL